MKTQLFRDVDVKVVSVIEAVDDHGVHLSGEDSERTEINVTGRYSFDGTPSLSYTEATEGGEVTTEITAGDVVTVGRRGAIESEFVFDESREHISVYKIPPYSFDVTVRARKIRNELSKRGGTLTVFYVMLIGGDRRNVKMQIDVYER